MVWLAGWALHPSELCALRAEQVMLGRENAEYPCLEFSEGERKNGPGTVALLVGVDEIAARIDALSEDAGWSGHLFPLAAAASGHVVTNTARNHFAALAKRAEVTVAGETPTPKMCRRFWYSIYGDAVRRIAERYTPIAETRGVPTPASSSTTTPRWLNDENIGVRPCTTNSLTCLVLHLRQYSVDGSRGSGLQQLRIHRTKSELCRWS